MKYPAIYDNRNSLPFSENSTSFIYSETNKFTLRPSFKHLF